MSKDTKEPEFLRKERIKMKSALCTKVVPSKNLYKRKKKDNDRERTD